MGKLPPQAPELEASVIGAMMIEKDAFASVADLFDLKHSIPINIAISTKPSVHSPSTRRLLMCCLWLNNSRKWVLWS